MKHKSVKFLRAKLKPIFSRYIRLRDRDLGCISCGLYIADDAYWQAGHFFDTAICYASLDFHEKNVNGQCSDCNNRLAGNKDAYQAALIERYGPSVLVELEEVKFSRALWGIQEYEEAIKKYQELTKVMI